MQRNARKDPPPTRSAQVSFFSQTELPSGTIYYPRTRRVSLGHGLRLRPSHPPLLRRRDRYSNSFADPEHRRFLPLELDAVLSAFSVIE